MAVSRAGAPRRIAMKAMMGKNTRSASMFKMFASYWLSEKGRRVLERCEIHHQNHAEAEGESVALEAARLDFAEEISGGLGTPAETTYK
jgi:hypothetical protein